MNPQLLLLALCQGLFLSNNVTFMAINGLVGLSLAPVPWMATLPLAGYVAGGAMAAPLVAKHQRAWGRRKTFQIWEPRALSVHEDVMRDKARSRDVSLSKIIAKASQLRGGLS